MRPMQLLFLLPFLLGTAPLEAQERAGSALLHPPPGWTRSDSRGVVRYSPASDPDAASIHVTAGEDAAVSLERWFAERWRQILSDLAPVEVRPQDAGRTSAGVQWRIAMAALDQSRGGPYVVVLLALADANRIQPVVVTFRDAAAFGRYASAAEQSYNRLSMLPSGDRPDAVAVDLATLVSGGGAVVTGRSAPLEGRPAGANPPGRLRGSTWRVVHHQTGLDLSGRSSGVVTVSKELFLRSDGSYEYREGRPDGGRWIESGSYDVQGDRLILRGSSARLSRAGAPDERSAPRNRSFTWYLAHDPEVEDLGRRVPAMRLSCPGGPHCFAVLMLRDESGRSEMWRPHD